jgi:hypothetical protein
LSSTRPRRMPRTWSWGEAPRDDRDAA